MVKVQATEVERAVMFQVLNRPGAWGGGSDALLAQDDIYVAFRLAQFEGRKTIDVRRSADKPATYQVPSSAVAMLRGVLAAAGQDKLSARIAARLLRRIPDPNKKENGK